MAKKKKKGAGAKDVDDMSKSELKAYHKEIREFFLENGWRDTLSYFRLSPKQGSALIDEKLRAKRKKLEKESKKAAAAEAKKKAPKKKAKAKPKSKAKGKKRGRPKKKPDAAESKAPKKKAPKKTAKKKPKGKKRGRPPGKTAGKQNIQEPKNIDGALDFLLAYRNTNGPVTLDEAIVDLTLRSRAA